MREKGAVNECLVKEIRQAKVSEKSKAERRAGIVGLSDNKGQRI